MPKPIEGRQIRVGIYGTGNWANRTHIPNLQKLDGVEIVALCDVNADALRTTAEKIPGARTYTDGHEMLRSEKLDVLYSCVPAYARTDVEVDAAERGVHLFSEKPQAIRMKVANGIDRAIRDAGVLNTVGFRERYRPAYDKARRILADKRVVHIRFISFGDLPKPPPKGREDSWQYQMEKSGGSAFDWGVHAVDYARYITGLNITAAQAFYCERPVYPVALSSSFNFRLSNGGTMTMTFANALGGKGSEWGFTVLYEGGRLDLGRRGEHIIEVNGETVFEGEPFDPWFEQDRAFIEAVRTGDGSPLRNDYHDGLFSLAPVLAGWESARRNGELIDIEAFMRQ